MTPNPSPVFSITQWLQRFAVYTAVVTRKQPSRVVDLMGYQILLLEAYHNYRNDSWLHYDQRYHLQAASQPGRKWAYIDTTSWNLAFAGEAKVNRCHYKHLNATESTSRFVTIVSKLSVVTHGQDWQHTFSSRRGIALHFSHVHHGRFPGGSGFSLDPLSLSRALAKDSDHMLPLSISGTDHKTKAWKVNKRYNK